MNRAEVGRIAAEDNVERDDGAAIAVVIGANQITAVAAAPAARYHGKPVASVNQVAPGLVRSHHDGGSTGRS